MGYDCLIRLPSSDISSLIVLILLVRCNKKTREIITLSSLYFEGKFEINKFLHFAYILCPVGFDYLLFTVL